MFLAFLQAGSAAIAAALSAIDQLLNTGYWVYEIFVHAFVTQGGGGTFKVFDHSIEVKTIVILRIVNAFSLIVFS